jgi:hypothetical protein
LEYKGVKQKVNIIKLIARIFRRPEFEDVLEPTEPEQEPEQEETMNIVNENEPDYE